MKKALALATAACALAGAGFAFAGLAANKTVNIKSTAFAPKNVTIAGGETVTWKNVDTVNHQVVANNGAFASGQIGPNRTYARRIDTPGTYAYHDALHPTLKGTVKVTGAPPSVSIGASTPIAVYGNAIHLSGAVLAGRGGEHRHRLRAAVRAGLVRQDRRPPDDHERRLGLHHDASGAHRVQGDVEGQDERRRHGRGAAAAPAHARRPLVRRSRAQPGKYGGHWLYVQRANVFGEWISLKKVTLNSQSATRFKLRKLPHGLNRLRLFISTNQAGPGFFHGASPSLSFRRR